MDCRILLLLATVVSVGRFDAVFAQDDVEKTAVESASELADEAAATDQQPEFTGPVARYITVTNPVDSVIFARVRNALVALQKQADQEDRDAILILELDRGTSMFGQVRDLAKELTSDEYPRVKTVAWIPKFEGDRPLDGFIGIIGLSCTEVVMHPDAEFGDIGRGKALEEVEQLSVINTVEKRKRPRVNGALAAGFVDPARTVLKIRVETNEGGQQVTEDRIVTSEELQRLQNANVAIVSIETVKEAGDILILSGARARSLGILVRQTARDRVELADIYGFDRRYLQEDVLGGEIPDARIIKLEGVIDPIMHEYAEREIRRAIADGANLIIFDITSPGGYLVSSEGLADTISLLDAKQVRTIAYVREYALSGAAIVSMGCDEILMHPDATIGDAGPIEMRPGQAFERAPEKILSDLRETMKILAERKHRPPALLEAMADRNLEVFQATHRETGRVWYMTQLEIDAAGGEWIKGGIVPESREENLLTITGRRAHDLKIAGEPVRDMGELKLRLGIPPERVVPAAEQTWVDTFIAILKSPAATYFLFFCGIICIYLEAQTTTGFFAIAAALCFAVYFWAQFLGGTAEWLEVILFLIGAGLIALEIFVIPGFGVFGITGGLAVVFSLILASQTFVIPSTSAELSQLSWTMGMLSSSIISVVVAAAVLSRFLPYIPGLGSLLLAPPTLAETGPRLDPRLADVSIGGVAAVDLLDRQGVAFSTLRPAGKAQIDGQLIDVVSDGGFVDPGTPVEVILVEGNRVVVRPIG
jgi:membrane-bound serine protease (ClpP class)